MIEKMNMIISLSAGLFLGMGICLILLDLLRFPSGASRKLIRRNTKKKDGKSVESLMAEVSVWISEKIRLSEYKRQQLLVDIKTAGIDITPEMYVANAVTKGLFIGVIAIPFLFVFPVIAAIIVVIAVIVTSGELRSLQDKIRDKREAIEYELPRFVANIEKTLKHNRDVLSMLESYVDVAGDELREELATTIADMRTGNFEIAVSRLEARTGSTLMSDVCRGLISAMRGDDTAAYWATLDIKLTDYSRQRMRERANRIPKKTRRLSFMLLGCFLLIYVVVIGVTFVNEMGVFY